MEWPTFRPIRITEVRSGYANSKPFEWSMRSLEILLDKQHGPSVAANKNSDKTDLIRSIAALARGPVAKTLQEWQCSPTKGFPNPIHMYDRRPPISNSSSASKPYLDFPILNDRWYLPDTSIEFQHFLHPSRVVLNVDVAYRNLTLANLIPGGLSIRSSSLTIDHDNSAHGHIVPQS